MEIFNKKKFAKTALDENVEVFVVYVTPFNFSLMPIQPIQKAQIALLFAKKVKIPTKYSDFSDVFLGEKAAMLLETIEFNQHVIELQKDQQPLYASIYSLGLIKL